MKKTAPKKAAKVPAKKTAARKSAANKAAAKKPAPAKTAAKKSAAKVSAKKRPLKKVTRTVSAASGANSNDASALIDGRIAELGDWRGETLARLRALIHEAVPAVVETWKWRGVPIFEHHGILCTGETYKEVVKTTFAKGASLPDPSKLFNSSLDGGTRRAIDIREGEAIDEAAFKALVRAAAALNAQKG